MRILIVDDEPAMHDSYRRSFAPVGDAVGSALGAMAAELFGTEFPVPSAEPQRIFDLTHRLQGLDGVAAVANALRDDAPFAVAFIDVRMPPGIDGRETAARIRALDPAIHIVIVTGYSDFAPIEIARVAGPADKIFYIAKPFEVAEVQQMATALVHRWEGDRELTAARRTLAEQVVQLQEQGHELAANESRAMHLANHDSLTEAPNRLAFRRALSERAKSGAQFAVAMVDLDRFKLVNDTLGHLAGDELIRAMCGVLQRSVPPGGMVARLGGDEFGLLFDTPGSEAAEADCARIAKACASTFKVLGHSVQGGASIGLIATEPGETRDPVDLMRRADLALNDAKRDGRGIVRVFDDGMDETIRMRRAIETGLSGAIARNELSLAYQPIVGRERLEIVGFEALLRWNTDAHGPISPDVFIPIAEESNLIHEIGDWVLRESLKVLAEWPTQYVSVNFSPRQFRRHNFVARLVEDVQRAGVDPTRVQIEITETAIFDDADRAADTLYKLRQMGFRIALDDFGTGYSSLYNIRKFALDCLKIDRSFIEGMGRERESAAIVQSIIHLGRALGLGVIAEGVESEAQLQSLRVAGCSHMQGFLFSRPVTKAFARQIAVTRFMVDADDGQPMLPEYSGIPIQVGSADPA
ncbi:GGDEF and EAL domain-containing protein [Sphingomonas sp. TREG-RG-20F-R18-01]|uniref:putative bifunctional diguanylate cyclase/phosphodiesterase n=1 Tax=Sphingomonas sp. TREG-RG-20F-R18-01 TaxID=2914982 RepID=UPI001F578E26|nr:GGDEF and EAL domain-containing protein [Sphingomonas sp. TREG-RG-20F-R18-01]